MPRAWPALDLQGLGASDLLQAALIEYDVAAIDERTPDLWRVFFATTGARDRAAADLPTQFADLSATPVDVPDEDWAARSQASLRAVRVGAIIVAPPWDVPEPTTGAPVVIVIEPSMGFGTGHHATTRLCLAALQAIDLRDVTVADVGTGSGVLAIAAARLGARHAVGVDDDADAIASARENLTINERAAVAFHVADLRTATLEPADVVLANLTGGLLEAAAPRLGHLTTPTGRLILSGLTTDEEARVLAAFAPLVVERRGQEDEWVCVTLMRAGGLGAAAGPLGDTVEGGDR